MTEELIEFSLNFSYHHKSSVLTLHLGLCVYYNTVNFHYRAPALSEVLF